MENILEKYFSIKIRITNTTKKHLNVDTVSSEMWKLERNYENYIKKLFSINQYQVSCKAAWDFCERQYGQCS